MKTMNQLNKEERGLGMNPQAVDLVPEPKRTKLDVDDPNITKVEDGTGNPSFAGIDVADGTENPSFAVEDGTENPSFAVEDGCESPSFADFLERNFVERGPLTREELYELGMLKVIDEELAESGVDIKGMRERWKDCEVKCKKCGNIDYHPEDECPYGKFIYI